MFETTAPLDLAAPHSWGLDIAAQAALAGHTTMKVGGAAEYFATVTTVPQMIRLVRWARTNRLPYYILGGGSNVLISDRGIQGLVIYNRMRQVRVDPAPCCVFTTDDRPFVFAESGTLMAGVARISVSEGLSGLEWAVSLPGTVGGAVINNAGAYGMEVKDNLYNAMILAADGDYPGDIEEVAATQLAYGYRSSSLKRRGAVRAGFGPVVLSANFRLGWAVADNARTLADQNLQHRRRTQPREPSLGSTFQNPPGDHAGRLIEAAGLKGQRLGGVQVSERHANFIINPGGVGKATAGDVLALMRLIRTTVAERFGVQLEPEVQLVGEWTAAETQSI
jgi:UDP-N-acetylmuramate dehydrogenase